MELTNGSTALDFMLQIFHTSESDLPHTHSACRKANKNYLETAQNESKNFNFV